jgi:hypothetical protein
MNIQTHELHLHDPQTLYRHWEQSQWSPWDIDLSIDRERWHVEEPRAFALEGLTRRLKLIGVPLETL